MPLEWTHDWGTCPRRDKNCWGDKECPEFPTREDRIAMARAAYREYAEADDTPLEEFVQDVEMLARADGLVQRVWVVTGPGLAVPKVFATAELAQANCTATKLLMANCLELEVIGE